jgi:uncharacterized protein involved in exopolysaccharide biosynthesis
LTEYSPLEAFEHAIRQWRLLVILTIVGGLCGLIFHNLQPPIYDATIVFTIGIDFKHVGRELTQYEEDLAVGAAGGLILSTDVVEKVIAQARSEQIQIDYAELIRMSRLERRQSLWELRVRNTDPEKAERLANLWGQFAIAALQQARQHAWLAYRISDELQELKQCVHKDDPAQSQLAFCDQMSSQELEQAIAVKENDLNTELQAARGILPALIFDLSQEARQSGKPVAYHVNLLVLSGAIIGFLVGVLFSSVRSTKNEVTNAI